MLVPGPQPSCRPSRAESGEPSRAKPSRAVERQRLREAEVCRVASRAGQRNRGSVQRTSRKTWETEQGSPALKSSYLGSRCRWYDAQWISRRLRDEEQPNGEIDVCSVNIYWTALALCQSPAEKTHASVMVRAASIF